MKEFEGLVGECAILNMITVNQRLCQSAIVTYNSLYWCSQLGVAWCMLCMHAQALIGTKHLTVVICKTLVELHARFTGGWAGGGRQRWETELSS